MGTIFNKGVSGDQCLILNPREALFYNFDFGTGWKEIRMGISHSFTSSTGDNSLPLSETITNTSFNNTNLAYCGFINSPDNSLPYVNTGVFVGLYSHTGSVVTYSNGGVNTQYNAGVIFGPNVSGTVFNQLGTFYFSSASLANNTGDVSYLAYHAVRIVIDSQAKTFAVRSANMGNNQRDASTQKIRIETNGFSNPLQNSTGYYTTDFTSGGSLLPYPNKILIYMPFYNNRIRIHNLLIEKYS